MRSVTHIILNIALLFLVVAMFSCKSEATTDQSKNITEEPSLKGAFAGNFYVGVAMNKGHIYETAIDEIELINREFNSMVAENVMKWVNIHPKIDEFDFKAADQFVAYGDKHVMHKVGHTLVWHSQLSDWANDLTDKDQMSNHLKNHINTIVSRYKGKIDCWDVVNEALNEDGTYRESVFYNVMGTDYLVEAFRLASSADPAATFLYNDYNMWKPSKREGALKLVKLLRDNGVRIDGIGMQCHGSLLGPSIEDLENSIVAYANEGLEVHITELDVTALPNPWDLKGAEVDQNFPGSPFMNPYPEVLPDSIQIKLANRYEDLFKLFLKHDDKIERVTFWGLHDGATWLNGWPIKDRTNYPLLFDRNLDKKKAYDAVMALKN